MCPVTAMPPIARVGEISPVVSAPVETRDSLPRTERGRLQEPLGGGGVRGAPSGRAKAQHGWDGTSYERAPHAVRGAFYPIDATGPAGRERRVITTKAPRTPRNPTDSVGIYLMAFVPSWWSSVRSGRDTLGRGFISGGQGFACRRLRQRDGTRDGTFHRAKPREFATGTRTSTTQERDGIAWD